MAGVNDNLIPPVHGEVRNPKGRGKGVPNSKTRLIRLLALTENMKNPVTGELEGFTIAEQMDLAQIIKAREGDTKAYTALLDRLEGKPQQVIDMSLDQKDTRSKIREFLDDSDNNIDTGTDDERAELAGTSESPATQ